jgi:hypothetical protein
MNGKLLVILIVAIGYCTSASACEVSLPEAQNLPASELQPIEGFVWVGSPELAARVPQGGLWKGMGLDYQFRDKWWWWREGYSAPEEPVPELEITAIMLDGEAPTVHIPHATNAMEARDPPGPPRWHRILTLMEFPAPGCWAVTATYHGNELHFVFQVGG